MMNIHEPATLLTDYLLAVLGGGLAWRLWRHPVIRIPSGRWWFRALIVLSLSAFVGGSYHGFAPNFSATVDAVWWRGVLWIICLLGFTMGSALVSEFSGGDDQVFWKRFLVAKFVLASVAVMVWPSFLVAIVDYGLAMLAWFVAALVVRRPWRSWIIVAVGLSGTAAWVQQSGLHWLGFLNHNDIFHLIQGLALVGFYRAAVKMRGIPDLAQASI